MKGARSIKGMSERPHLVIVRFNPEAIYGMDYYVEEGLSVRVLVVDEDAPSDGIYELAQRFGHDELLEILGDSEIGHAGDERHEAVKHLILADLEGKPHLRPVDPIEG
jgi:hypothetical protein